MGLGMGLGLRRGRVWTLASLTSFAAHYPAIDVPATLVKATAVVDRDFAMEEAGVGFWSGYNGGTPSKVADPRTGSSGAQSLLGTGDGTAYSGVVNSISMITGNTYYVTGWLTSASKLQIVLNGIPVYNAIPGTSWVYFANADNASGPSLVFRMPAAGAGETFGADDLTVANMSLTRWNPAAAIGPSVVGGYLSIATASSQPSAAIDKIGTHFAVRFDAAGYGGPDYYVHSAAASAWPLHRGATVVFTLQPGSTGAGVDTLFDQCNANASNVGWTLDYDTAAQTLRLLVANGTGTFAVNASIACAKGASHYVEIYWSSAGYSLRVDGGAATTGAITGALSAADATSTLNVGRKTSDTEHYQGLLGDVALALAADPSGSVQAGALLKTEYGL